MASQVQGAPTLKFSIDRILSDSSTDDHSDYSSLSPTSSVSPSPPATPIYLHSSTAADLQQSATTAPAHVLIRNHVHSAIEGSRPLGLESTAIIRTAPSVPYPFLLQVAALQTAGYPRSPTLGAYAPYGAGATIAQLPGATRTPLHAPLPAAFYFVTNRGVVTDGRPRGAGTASTTEDLTTKSMETGDKLGEDRDQEECGVQCLETRTHPSSSARPATKSTSFKKKKRTAFTSAQLQELENMFEQQKYLTKRDRCSLADALGLTEKHVKTWYQNRRTKWKRDTTTVDWSKQREHAATLMYAQYLQMKPTTHSEDEHSQYDQLQQCRVF